MIVCCSDLGKLGKWQIRKSWGFLVWGVGKGSEIFEIRGFGGRSVAVISFPGRWRYNNTPVFPISVPFLWQKKWVDWVGG